ncbi:hypothetical protein ACO1PF_12235 [Alkalibacterium sp. f15]|uniref:hypothetical protein n=1 Tax=Alkalibacterium sp. f15 TaxID=3414029 RepID=UPI003BF7A32D
MVLTSSFMIFAFFSSYLFYSMIYGNIAHLSIVSLVMLAISGLFFVKQLRTEWGCIKCQLKQPVKLSRPKNLNILLALVGGAYITFILNHQLGLGGVLASSVIGLSGAYLFKNYAAAIYCGSFVGMACNLIFSNPFSFMLASLIAGILFILSEQLFKGYGGKLGFIAFCGTFLSALVFRSPFRTLDPLSTNLYLPLFLIIIFAGMATYLLQDMFLLDAVTASALVGLTIAILSPQNSHIIVVAAFCATFTGMVSKERAKTYTEMFFLTILTGILFIAVASLFDGSGGKLGATAFLATVSGRSMLNTLFWLKHTYIKTKKQSVKIL